MSLFYCISLVLCADPFLVRGGRCEDPYRVCTDRGLAPVGVNDANVNLLTSELNYAGLNRGAVVANEGVPGRWMLNNVGDVYPWGGDLGVGNGAFCRRAPINPCWGNQWDPCFGNQWNGGWGNQWDPCNRWGNGFGNCWDPCFGNRWGNGGWWDDGRDCRRRRRR